MIIIDLNQVSISNLMQQLGNHLNSKLDENMLRHMILNSIRSYNTKFGQDYGEIVIACDDRNYWRRQIFPYYKAHRKKAREQSELDWSTIFITLEKIRNELKEFFPYKVIHIDNAEADDVIGSLAMKYGTEDPIPLEKPILILSGDKDFVQLQTFTNVKQYDPIRKKWITHNNPKDYLYEHICKGDVGDGIPNILSDDNTFVSDKRQKPMTQKKIDLFKQHGIEDKQIERNFFRNSQLVDLKQIPDYIRTAVIDKYEEPKTIGKSKLMNYFIEHKLKNLMEHVGEF